MRVQRLGCLKNSVFFEKGDRTEESWLKRKEKEIANLEAKLGVRRG